MKSTAESSVFEKHSILGPYLLNGPVVLVVFALTTMAYAYDVTLAWDPNDEPDLAGYGVYVNEDAWGSLFYPLETVSLDDVEPGNPRYTVTELRNDVDYCFVVSAYTADGSESTYSNTICVIGGWVHDSRDVAFIVSRGGGSDGCFLSIASCQLNGLTK
jgi:hypothetical protein